MSREASSAAVCVWSNRPDPGTRQVSIVPAGALEKPTVYNVCLDHERLLRRHLDRVERHRSRALAAMGVVVASALVPLFLESTSGLAVPLLALGATLIAFPYATPMTVARNGVAASVRALRMFGCVLLAFGAIFAALAFV